MDRSSHTFHKSGVVLDLSPDGMYLAVQYAQSCEHERDHSVENAATTLNSNKRTQT